MKCQARQWAGIGANGENRLVQENIEQLNQLEKHLDIAVSVAAVDSEVETRLKKLAKTAKVRGFRPGKVPLKVVAQQFGKKLREEVLGDAVQRGFASLVREQNFKVVGFPRIEPRPAPQGAAEMQFSATFEVYPDVVVGDLSGVEIERPSVQVLEEDVDKTVEILRKQRATYPVVDSPAGEGDEVDLDYSGTVEGEPLQGGQASAYRVVLGNGRMLDEFERRIYGMARGESKSFDLVFPDNYHAKELLGKTAHFDVTVNSVGQPVLPEVDAEFAKSLGVADGDTGKMRDEVRVNLQREVNKRIKARLKERVMQAVLHVTRLDVPKALVEMELEALQEGMRKTMAAQGGADKSPPLPAEFFEAQARRRASLGLIITELARSQRLQPSAEQVRGMVDEHAQSYEDPQRVVDWYYADPQRLREVESLMLEENVVAWVLQRAKV
ncbi:MAG: trigger factor, partial [Burkholderiales bacterium]